MFCLFIFSSLASKKKKKNLSQSEAILHVSSRALNCKRRQKEETAINFCAAYCIALIKWMFVPFASQTKSLSAAKDNAAHLLLPLIGEGWDVML